MTVYKLLLFILVSPPKSKVVTAIDSVITSTLDSIILPYYYIITLVVNI